MRTADAVDRHNAGLVVDAEEPTLSTPDLTGLSEAEREVWVSVEVHGLRPAEVARTSEWSSSTVRTLLARARKKRGDAQ